MSNKQLISVVVPVYNEEENIQAFYQAINKATVQADYALELIFVNDGSADRSLALLTELAKQDARIIVINFSRNFGSYAAIEAGFTAAKGDAVMAISADLQDPPEIINAFVPKWREGCHIVWGVRSTRKDPVLKTIFADAFYWLIRKIVFPKFPRRGMDIGLFDRRIIELFLAMKDRHSIPFFTIYAMGFKQAQIPYDRRERVAGKSGWPFWKRVKCAVDIFVSFSYVPIRLVTGVGFIFSILAFIYAFVLVILKLLFNDSASGWSSLAVLVLFIGGIQMIFLGIIAEYIWRISDRVKNKPTYCIMDTISQQSTESSQQISSQKVHDAQSTI